MDPNTGLTAVSGCSTGGSAFACPDFQPIPVADNLSYGFAMQVGDTTAGANSPLCCICQQVEWTSGSAQNKTMIVQIVGPGTASGSVTTGDLIILTPGGGVGPTPAGCTNQYGTSYNWYGLLVSYGFMIPCCEIYV